MICCSDAHYLEDIHEPEYQIYARSKELSDILDALDSRIGALNESGGGK